MEPDKYERLKALKRATTRQPLPAQPKHPARLEDDLGRGAAHAGEARDGLEHALARAEDEVVLEPGRPVGAGIERLLSRRERRCEELGGAGGVGALSRQRGDDPARAVGIVEGEPTLETGDMPPCRRTFSAAVTRADRLSSDPTSTVSQRAAAERIAEVPFVVERISVGALAPCANSRGEAPTSKPSTTTPFRSPPTTA